jgi:hypothetical protein
LLGQLGGRLDAGQSAADHGDRSIEGQLLQPGTQPLCGLQLSDVVGEFGRAGHRRRCRSGAADRVDHIVVVQCASRCQPYRAGGGVDTRGAVDDQLDALAEQRAVVDSGLAGTGHELVQPDAFDELRARIDQSDFDVGACPQAVGRERPGVPTADDHDLVGVAVFAHALKTPRADGDVTPCDVTCVTYGLTRD